MSDAFKEALGLSITVSDAIALTTARELKAKAEEKAGEAQALSVQLEAANTELSVLRKEKEERVKAEAQDYITKLKTDSAAAGSPIDDEKLSAVREHFDAGRPVIAKQVGDAYLALSIALGKTVSPGAKKLDKPSGDVDVAALRESAAERSLALSAAGIRIDVDDEGNETYVDLLKGEK